MAKAIDYNKLANELLGRRTKPYPVNKYNHRSSKYRYVYNVSIDGIVFWHAKLDNGHTWDDDCYFKTEEDAAIWVYKQIKKYLKRVIKYNKSWDNKKRIKHINWQKWLLDYQKWQYPKIICEFNVF